MDAILRYLWQFGWCLLFAAPLWSNAQLPEDLFDFDHSLEFAHYLENQKAFPMALEEYQRLDGMKPGNLEVRAAILRLCGRTGQAAAGVKAYESWDYHPYLAPEKLRDAYIGLNFLSRDFDRFERKLHDGIGLKAPLKSRVELQLALYQEDWGKAYSLFETFEIQHVRESKETFEPIMNAISSIRYHNPTQGALLSIIPGLGQARSKQWGAALGSLTLIGLSTYGSAQFFRKKGPENVFSWGFLTMGLFSYSANILGGYNAAKRYNKKQDEKIISWLDEITIRSF